MLKSDYPYKNQTVHQLERDLGLTLQLMLGRRHRMPNRIRLQVQNLLERLLLLEQQRRNASL